MDLRWSTGNTLSIQPGDRAFLLKQGGGKRGIFGRRATPPAPSSPAITGTWHERRGATRRATCVVGSTCYCIPKVRRSSRPRSCGTVSRRCTGRPPHRALPFPPMPRRCWRRCGGGTAMAERSRERGPPELEPRRVGTSPPPTQRRAVPDPLRLGWRSARGAATERGAERGTAFSTLITPTDAVARGETRRGSPGFSGGSAGNRGSLARFRGWLARFRRWLPRFSR